MNRTFKTSLDGKFYCYAHFTTTENTDSHPTSLGRSPDDADTPGPHMTLAIVTA